MTYYRRPILSTELARTTLRGAITDVQQKRLFTIEAVVLLPDHLHTIWTLPDDDSDFSTCWALIKEAFTRRFLSAGGTESIRTPSRIRHRERNVWQRRFWEHTIRDEDDFKRCLDYVRYNPVKHGLVERVRDYPWSSFTRYVRLGEYELEWGSEPAVDVDGAEWE